MKLDKNIFMFISLLSFHSISFSTPVALVEDINIKSSDIELLDILSEGDEISLGKTGSITLGYFKSCFQEQITGGQITIGELKSNVTNSKIITKTTECDGLGLSLAANQASQSGAIAVRDINKNTDPDLIINHVSPLIRLEKQGRVTIKRIDEVGERYKIKAFAEHTTKPLIDLLHQGIKLTPGAKYMLTSSGKSLIFLVSENASDNKEKALLTRLILL